MRRPRAGLTLIELLISIAISTILMAAIYFSLTSALESWDFTRDALALQQVVGGLVKEMMEGARSEPSLRVALDLREASEERVSFIIPWTEQQQASGGLETFQLAQYVLPGSGLPEAEVRFAESEDFKPLPVAWEDPDDVTQRQRLKARVNLAPGSAVRFTYHPDPERAPEAVVTYRWDPDTQMVYRDRINGTEPLGKNPYGVVITECRFRYYDPTNAPIAESGDLSETERPRVTAVEVRLTGRLGSQSLTLFGMAMLRNSPPQSGFYVLRPGLRVPLPDSRSIRILTLTNLVGVTAGDELQLEARPKQGKAWRVMLRFERYGQARPVIAQVTVEYPPGNPIYTERPRVNAEEGLNLLALGPAGLYDYDDDPEQEDLVLLKGDPVLLSVTKMDVGGAALFVG